MEFKDKVEYARKKLNISQSELALRLKSSFAMVNRWESGKIVPSAKKEKKFNLFCEENGISFNEEKKDNIFGTKIITAQQIDTWFSEESITSQCIFPELVRRLILESTKNIKNINFPNGDKIYTPGFDGELTCDSESIFVPNGKSVWEIGATLKSSKKKITSDYKKRTENTPLATRKETSFILVTPNIFSNKGNWCKQKENEWKSVKIIDCNDLELWLSFCINTSIWLAEKYMNKILKISTFDNYWGKFKARTTPHLTESFFVEKRENELNKIEDLLVTNKIIKIAAHSKLESMGFILSSFSSKYHQLSNRVIIVEDIETLEFIENFVSNKIIIVSFQINTYSFVDKNQYILLYGRDYDETNSMDIVLGLRSSNLITTVLKRDMNVDENIIKKIKNKSKNSVTLVIKELASSSDIMSVPWNKEDLVTLIPLLLIGRININDKNDLAILQKFIFNNDIDSYLLSVEKWRKIDDSPIFFYDHFIKVNEKEAVWIQLKNELNHYFEKIKNTILEIFSSYNPKYDLEKDKRIFADVYNKKWKYNKYIIEGLLDSIILYSIYNKKENEVNLIVSKLFENLNNEKSLLTFSEHFMKMAEASPSSFIFNIKNLLSNNKLDILFNSPETDLFLKSNEYCNLLWALELILSIEEYKFESLNLLYDLYEKEYTYNLSNSPKESLINKLHFIDNHTLLSFDDKERFLSSILKREKSHLAISLILSLLNTNTITFTGAELRWRYSEIIEDKITWEKIFKFQEKIIISILNNDFTDVNTVFKLYELKNNLSYKCISIILNFCIEHFKVNTYEGNMIYEYFVKEKFNVFRYHKDEYKDVLVLIENVINYFTPNDYLESVCVYFRDFSFHGCPNTSLIRDNFREEEKEAKKFRIDIVSELMAKYPKENVIKRLIEIIPNQYLSASIFDDIVNDDLDYKLIIEKAIVYKKYNILSYLIDSNIGLAKKVLALLSDNEFENILPAFEICNGNILDDTFLRNNVNIKKVFSKRYMMHNLSNYEIEKIRIFNPISYLSWVNYNIPFEQWEFEKILDTLMLVTNENMGNSTYVIEELLQKIDKNYASEKLLQIEIKFINIFHNQRLLNGILEYLFLHPDELIYLLENKDETYQNIRYKMYSSYSLPCNFYSKPKELSNFINLFLKYDLGNGLNNSVMKQNLGQILARTSDICQDNLLSKNVRAIIEEAKDEQVNRGYYIGLINSRGARRVGDGTTEYKKAKELELLAQSLMLEFPETSKIVRMISRDYYNLSNHDKMDNLIMEDIL